MIYTQTIEITAPLGRVFALLEDPAKQVLWMEGLAECVFTSTPELGREPGSTFVQRMRGSRGRAEFRGEVLAKEKPWLLTLRVGNPAFSAEIEYRLEPITGGTRLAYRTTVTSSGRLARLTDTLLRGPTKRIARRQLERLKTVAERS